MLMSDIAIDVHGGLSPLRWLNTLEDQARRTTDMVMVPRLLEEHDKARYLGACFSFQTSKLSPASPVSAIAWRSSPIALGITATVITAHRSDSRATAAMAALDHRHGRAAVHERLYTGDFGQTSRDTSQSPTRWFSGLSSPTSISPR